MAATPLTFLEKKRIAQIHSGSGHFIESARQNSQRRRINPLNRDGADKLGKALQRGLSEQGHACDWARNGHRGIELASTQT